MKEVVQIKAKSEKEAIDILRTQKSLPEEGYKFYAQILVPGKSILGLFSTKNLYEVTYFEENKSEKKVMNLAKELLDMMNLDLDVEVVKANEHFVSINLYGPDNGIIIGKKGKTLNSFEYLLNSLIKGCKVEVDVEGFKEKRANTLRDLARKMAERVIKTNKTVKLNAMPPRERKIIHEIVSKYEELDTYSEGKDPKRYIVIKKKVR